MISDIDAPLHMIAYQGFDCLGVEDARRANRIRRQNVHQEAAERSPEPVMSRYIESRLLAIDDGGRQLAAHQFLQDEFLLKPADLECRGQGGRKLDDPAIQKLSLIHI